MPFLDWVNKHQAVQSAQKVPYRLLRTVGTHGNVDGPNADKLLIQGDNLLALKALLPFCREQVTGRSTTCCVVRNMLLCLP